MRSRNNDIHIAPVTNAVQVACLVNDVWQSQYPNDANLHIWPDSFFNWQFLQTPESHPAICLGAFCDNDLVGVHCCDIWPILEKSGCEQRFTFISCVSVRSGPYRHQASAKLLAAVREWSEQHRSQSFFGFVNPMHSAMVGRRYWMSRANLSPTLMEGLRQWQLVTRPEAEKEFIQIAKPTLDLDQAADFLCVRLAECADDARCSIRWSKQRMRHQLRFGALADFLCIQDDNDHALCNYTIMDTYGGWKTAYIDFLMASPGRTDLLNRALGDCLAKVRAKGCRRVMTLGAPTNRDCDLEALGFTPCIPSYTPIFGTWGSEPSFLPHARMAVIYR